MRRPNKATLRWIFVGSDGIRAGWSVLIFLLVLGIPAAIIGFVVRKLLHITPPKTLGPWSLLITEILFASVVLAATAIMARIERRPFLSYGLTSPRPLAHALSGWAGGFICLSLLVGFLAATGTMLFDGAALHGARILFYGIVWLVAFGLVGLSEEAMFRGYVQSTLTRGMGFWPGAVLLSALFGAAHLPNHGETILGLTGVVLAGLAFCLLLRVSGSLWLGIGFHAAWDWAQTFIYGTPDSGYTAQGHFLNTHTVGNVLISGGSAGPEGSVLALPAMMAGLLALLAVCRGAGLFRGIEKAVPTESFPANPPVMLQPGAGQGAMRI